MSGCCALALLVSCQVADADRIGHAEHLAQRGRFLAALTVLDRVPPSDARYTEARTFAQALERRIRTSHEKILTGLTQRSEWRDEEALRSFEEAVAIWPDVHGATGLITATKNRILAMGEERQANPVAPSGPATAAAAAEIDSPAETLETTPVGRPSPRVPAGPMAETKALPEQGEAALAQPAKAAESSPLEGQSRVQRLRRRQRLEQVARLQSQGDMDEALEILTGLFEESPEDRQILSRLVRVLHQRALLAYGQGRLEAAIDDWQKVDRLDPGNTQSKAFLRAAGIELDGRAKR